MKIYCRITDINKKSAFFCLTRDDGLIYWREMSSDYNSPNVPHIYLDRPFEVISILLIAKVLIPEEDWDTKVVNPTNDFDIQSPVQPFIKEEYEKALQSQARQ